MACEKNKSTKKHTRRESIKIFQMNIISKFESDKQKTWRNNFGKSKIKLGEKIYFETNISIFFTSTQIIAWSKTTQHFNAFTVKVDRSE